MRRTRKQGGLAEASIQNVLLHLLHKWLLKNNERVGICIMLKEFMHPEFGQLEVVIIEDKEYFAAVDCAKILGYSNPRDAVSDIAGVS